MTILLILMLAFVGTAEAETTECAKAKRIANYDGAVPIESRACIDDRIIITLGLFVDGIKAEGYTCDSVSSAINIGDSYTPNFYFACDEFSNEYLIEIGSHGYFVITPTELWDDYRAYRKKKMIMRVWDYLKEWLK